MGYRLAEIAGRHHSLFIEAGARDGDVYELLEPPVRRPVRTAEFRRVAKDGHIVHIQGSYNPVFDRDGRLLKIVKFATDVNAQARDREHRAELQEGAIVRDLNAIADASSNVSQQAGQAADSSTRVSTEIQAVASGAEELAASVTEIGGQVAAGFGDLRAGGSIRPRRRRRSSAAQRGGDAVGEVVALIQSIAAQTNLLALNATIEAAARRREAGGASRWSPPR